MPAVAATGAAKDLSSLERQVRHELITLPFLSVFDNLQFQVDGSTLVLSGQVARPSLKTSAERAVARIEGISRVENRIEVLPTSFHDDRVRLAVLRSVYGNTVLNRYALNPNPSIRIIVKNGDVRLEGVVAREMDKNVAFIQANSVPGVFSVTNNLRVENAG
jgi:hyperosmotically inducible protein